MSTTTPAVENGTESRSIEAGRFDRAVTSAMDVEQVTDRLYHVETDSGAYNVDLETGACQCPDAEYRGDRYVCKHAIRAALVETFAEGVTTELVARVVAHARAHPCPHGRDRLCSGPVGPRLPCVGCMDSVRSADVDEFDVWAACVTEDRA